MWLTFLCVLCKERKLFIVRVRNLEGLFIVFIERKEGLYYCQILYILLSHKVMDLTSEGPEEEVLRGFTKKGVTNP